MSPTRRHHPKRPISLLVQVPTVDGGRHNLIMQQHPCSDANWVITHSVVGTFWDSEPIKAVVSETAVLDLDKLSKALNVAFDLSAAARSKYLQAVIIQLRQHNAHIKIINEAPRRAR
jgi:hypothetical protein